MALKTNVTDLEYEEVLSMLASQQYIVCEKLRHPGAGEVYVCWNTKEGLFLTSFWCFLLLIRVLYVGTVLNQQIYKRRQCARTFNSSREMRIKKVTLKESSH